MEGALVSRFRRSSNLAARSTRTSESMGHWRTYGSNVVDLKFLDELGGMSDPPHEITLPLDQRRFGICVQFWRVGNPSCATSQHNRKHMEEPFAWGKPMLASSLSETQAQTEHMLSAGGDPVLAFRSASDVLSTSKNQPKRCDRTSNKPEGRHGQASIFDGSGSDWSWCAACKPALAQSFPSNVIRIVVPASASTPPDILARIVATALSEGEGWKVVVENKPGAVMTIGAMEVLEAAGRRLHAALGHGSGRGGSGSSSQRVVQYRDGLRATDPGRHRLQRAGGQSEGAGQFSV